MKFVTVCIVSLLVLLLILIIYAVVNDLDWVQKNYWLANYIENPWKVYSRSAGNFDNAAALALQRATIRETPTLEDHILAATIITRNIVSQEHVPERDIDGNLTTSAFELSYLRNEMFNNARGHFVTALQNLHNNLSVHAEFIINTATAFAVVGTAELVANDPILAIFINEVIDEPLLNHTTHAHENLIRERRANANTTISPVIRTENYINLATQNTNDLQNSHDTGVLACLKNIVDRLRVDQHDLILPSIDEVLAEIKIRKTALSGGRNHRMIDVEAVIDRIRLNERVVAVGATDSECLCRIWLRSTDPRNLVERDNLHQAIFDALYDCWEESIEDRKIVCVNGRTTRILSSLILLDWDHKNWIIKKFEQFKNDIYVKASEVILQCAKLASESDDSDIQGAGRIYLAKTNEEMAEIGNVSEKHIDQLADQMRAEINLMVDTYVNELNIKNAIPVYMIECIKKDAQAAVA